VYSIKKSHKTQQKCSV